MLTDTATACTGSARTRRQRKRFGALAAALAATLVVAGCSEQNTFQPPPPPQVSVAKPVVRKVTEFMFYTGNTEATATVKLRARIKGYLEQRLFQDGDVVLKDQVLFTIQQSQYEAQVKAAQAKVEAAKASLGLAENEVVKFAQAARTQAVAQIELQRREFERDTRKAELLAAEAELALAELDLSYTEVQAPFDGRMGKREWDVGNLVGVDGDTVLAEINQVDPIYVYFTINERDLLQVMRRLDVSPARGMQTRPPLHMALAGQDGFPHEGYLDFAAITLDPSTGTLLLRGVFENPDLKIVPGLFARLRAPVGAPADAMLVPQVAVNSDQVGEYVLVVGDDNRVERRGVTTGAVDEGLRVVEDGLGGDEWVVVNGMLRAIPGREVTPKRVEIGPDGSLPPVAGEAPPAGGEDKTSATSGGASASGG